MPIASSELILNEDQSIYHLNLHPTDLANTIITVGDPERVALVSSFFDTIEVKKQKREFLTHTGTYNQKRITVISTGIGTDNIDIVLNELDALANINFTAKTIKKTLKSLRIIRIGTSGAVQENIPIGTILLSEKAIGLDALMHFYHATHIIDTAGSAAFVRHMKWDANKPLPYMVNASASLLSLFNNASFAKGITLTNVGFYGPQARNLRLNSNTDNFHNRLKSFRYLNKPVTNLEMETAGIYGLCALLGHQAISINCILANRALGTFSSDPETVVKQAVEIALKTLTQ